MRTQVAILCNHQRSVPKGHAGQMEKLEAKTLALQQELRELQDNLKAAKKAHSPAKADTCAPAQKLGGVVWGGMCFSGFEVWWERGRANKRPACMCGGTIFSWCHCPSKDVFCSIWLGQGGLIFRL